VRGGVHALAYAKALEELTGATVSKMLNIPNIPNSAFPETKKWEDQGSHHTLYRFSETDFTNLASVWKGVHPEDGEELSVQQGPPEGGAQADFPESPEHFAPGYDPGELAEIAKKNDGREVGMERTILQRALRNARESPHAVVRIPRGRSSRLGSGQF